MVDVTALSDALAKYGPFVVKAGADYIMLETPDGDSVDNIVITPQEIVWGARDEYRTAGTDVDALARAVLYTQRDAE